MIKNSIIKKSGIFLFLACFILFFALPSAADDSRLRIIHLDNKKYISVNELTHTIDIYNSFDIITGKGQLLHKGSVAVYQVEFAVILINKKLYKANYPVIRNQGEILLPLSFFRQIIDGFFDNYKIEEKWSYVLLERTQKKVPEPRAITGDKITFIMVDPGHGGKDPGAIGEGGVQEKGITLKISKLLIEYLNGKLNNVTVKTTRKTDKFLKLEDRAETANKMIKHNQNGIFVSIHANSSIIGRVSGFDTYYLSQDPSNEEARATAALENDVIVIYEDEKKKSVYDDVHHIEAIMLNTQIQRESIMLAKDIQKYMDHSINEFSSRGVKKADFRVLREALMPAVLVEVGFITNKKEAAALQKHYYQKKIAKGIGDGIIAFIKEYNKMLK